MCHWIQSFCTVKGTFQTIVTSINATLPPARVSAESIDTIAVGCCGSWEKPGRSPLLNGKLMQNPSAIDDLPTPLQTPQPGIGMVYDIHAADLHTLGTPAPTSVPGAPKAPANPIIAKE